jgi:hypothetical protein
MSRYDFRAQPELGRGMRTSAVVSCVLAAALCVTGCESSSANDEALAPTRKHGAEGSYAFASITQKFSNTGQPKVQFEGDSITYRSTPDINRRFRDRYDVAIQATIGVSAASEWKNIVAQSALRPDIEVVNLGTNDAARVGEAVAGDVNGKHVTVVPAQALDQTLDRFDAVVAKFPPSTCLVFVTVTTHNPTWGPDNARVINERLKELARRRDGMVLADWDAAWQASYFDDADDPHPNETGRRALLNIEQEAIDKCQRDE